ncbi:MAG: hypothetical protein ACYCV7_08800 [Acidimicrobiales bacterium]
MRTIRTRRRRAGAMAAALFMGISLTACQLHNVAPLPVSLYERPLPSGQLKGSVAYVTWRGVGESVIRVKDLATGTTRTIPTPRGWVTDLSWSPDGQTLAFGFSPGGETGPSHIWLVGRNGVGAVQITHGQSSEMDPSWSPSGRRIVFSSFASGHWSLKTVSVSNGSISTLPTKGRQPRLPSWSPSGSTIVYSARTGAGPFKLWSFDMASGRSRQLTTGPGNDLFASYNRSGKDIVFSSTRARDQWQTYVLGATGHVRPVIRSDSVERWPAWSPGGNHIMVTVPHLAVYGAGGKPLPGGGLRWRVTAGAGWSPSWT